MAATPPKNRFRVVVIVVLFSLGFRQDYRIYRINRILEVTILSFELKALGSEID